MDNNNENNPFYEENDIYSAGRKKLRRSKSDEELRKSLTLSVAQALYSIRPYGNSVNHQYLRKELDKLFKTPPASPPGRPPLPLTQPIFMGVDPPLTEFEYFHYDVNSGEMVVWNANGERLEKMCALAKRDSYARKTNENCAAPPLTPEISPQAISPLYANFSANTSTPISDQAISPAFDMTSAPPTPIYAQQFVNILQPNGQQSVAPFAGTQPMLPSPAYDITSAPPTPTYEQQFVNILQPNGQQSVAPFAGMQPMLPRNVSTPRP